MSLNRSISAEADAGTVFPHTAQEVWYTEARVAIHASRCYDIGRGKVAIDGCDELCSELGKVAPDNGTQLTRLITKLEKSFNLRKDDGIGFEEAFGWRMNLYSAAW